MSDLLLLVGGTIIALALIRYLGTVDITNSTKKTLAGLAIVSLFLLSAFCLPGLLLGLALFVFSPLVSVARAR